MYKRTSKDRHTITSLVSQGLTRWHTNRFIAEVEGINTYNVHNIIYCKYIYNNIYRIDI